MEGVIEKRIKQDNIERKGKTGWKEVVIMKT